VSQGRVRFNVVVASAVVAVCLAATVAFIGPASAIINGKIVNDPSQYPFAVHLSWPTGDGRRVSCTGSLIEPQWVLTAAHCMSHSNLKPAQNGIHLRIGSIRTNSGGEERLSDYWVEHNRYTTRKGSTKAALAEFDVALIHFSQPSSQTPVSIVYDAANYYDVLDRSEKLTAIGYGDIDFVGTGSAELRSVGLFDSYPPISEPIETGNSLVNDNKGPYSGDSGGPLIGTAGTYLVQLGVFSSFAGTSIPTNPNGGRPYLTDFWYANLGQRENKDWIDNTLASAPLPPPPGPPVPSPAPLPPQTPTPVAPAVPTGLHVTARTISSISLGWNSSTGATGYRVFNGGRQVAQVSRLGVTITGLKDNTAYTFTVAAYNGVGQSLQSAPINTRTLPTWKFKVLTQKAYDDTGNEADLGHLRPGQRGRVVITVLNTGSAVWTNSGPNPVLLGTDRPRDHASAIAAPGWISPTRAARLAEDRIEPQRQGAFSFPFVAPTTAGDITENFTPVAEGLSWFDDVGLYLRMTVVPIVGVAAAPNTEAGHWVVAADGGVFSYAGALFYGSMGGQRLAAPMVGMTATASGQGYWLVAADGGVFTYGDAPFYGSMGGKPLNKPIVGMAATPSGRGYWLVAADGGVFAFGDAGFHGSMGGKPLNKPMVGMAATPSGRGYWLVAADGGVFAFGDAVFAGSMGADGAPRSVVGMTATKRGYALVDAAGAVQTFNFPQQPAPRDTLHPLQQLNPGEQLVSSNGRYVLAMQTDGNLVEYEPSGGPVWSTGTGTPGTVLVNQADGNLVLVAPGNRPIWATDTRTPGSILTIQDDRNLVVYAPGHRAIWQTNTAL
jgi:Trypsin/Fibronectin type III domain